MWSSIPSSRLALKFARAAPIAAVMAGYASYVHPNTVSGREDQWSHFTSCDQGQTATDNKSRLDRKQTTLQRASTTGGSTPATTSTTARRFDTQTQLDEIRKTEQEMLLRWERDEDGWRELPARAWPAYQPNPEQLKGIQVQVQEHKCNATTVTKDGHYRANDDLCTQLLFNMATALVFYNVDPQRGLEQYEALAKRGHVDSMVACGIILVEGMGVPPQEHKGIEWLEQAVAQNSAQGCYELASVLYTGIDGVIDEDPQGAFELFRRAAEQDHTGGMYMMADCLLEGEGTEANVGRAIPLFYKAAERGHRYSRQVIRELLAASRK